MSRPITQSKALELLRDGWELGCGSYIRGGPMVTMQRQLGCGGEYHLVHVSSFRALRDRGLIEPVPGQSPHARSTKYRLAKP